MDKIKVVNYGLGVIGLKLVEQILLKNKFKIVGAIDIAEELVGKDLGEVIGIDKHLGIKISNNPNKILSETKPDIVVHATRSYMKQVFDQLSEIIKNKVNIVSTCEELSYPHITSPDLSQKLDKMAKQEGIIILGTGINPGFLMDYLPIVLTGPSRKVDKIEVSRQINASIRRIPFQKKIGAGLTLEDFHNNMEKGIITGHVGLEQSIGMIAAALKWKLDNISIGASEPIISQEGVSSDAITVKKGNVCGVKQKANGIKNGKEVISLDFRAYLGAEEEFDEIKIEGIPNINQRITPCIHGDIGTISMIINAIPRVIEASPGLKTMKDFPPPVLIP